MFTEFGRLRHYGNYFLVLAVDSIWSSRTVTICRQSSADYSALGDRETLGSDLSGSVLRTARLEETLTEGDKCEPAEEGEQLTHFCPLDARLCTRL